MVNGDAIGPYTIVAKLGEGGMGEVYRARDSKLKREVAIKVLPADVANDRERLARFQREAEVLASLNHPHIAHVYGIEDNALVMELVEGEDLSQRIARGPIPIDEALPIAKQIAEALETAHDAGIIHRDLKPANIKVREDGTIKVLDFGLAKAMESGTGSREPGAGNTLANSPTITSPAMTMRGVILGTAAYMSPEQAKGKAVDRRTDMWAFGCVLYEMLTGARAFEGEDVTEILGAVIKTEPDWTKLPADTPPVIRTLLNRCLRKKASERIDSAAVARFDIVDANSGTAPPPQTRGGSSRGAWPIAIVAMLIAAGATYLLWSKSPPAAEPVGLRFEIPMKRAPGVSMAVSPDGGHVAYIEEQAGPLRRLNSVAPIALPGTKGATNPFWSPDSRFVAFAAGNRLMKIDISGGPPVEFGPVENDPTRRVVSGSWSPDGTVLAQVATSGDPMLVSFQASETTPATPLPKPAGIRAMLLPSFLPDGRHFLHVVTGDDAAQSGIWVASLDGRVRKRLSGEISKAVYSRGHVIFVRDGTLMAQPFDTERLEYTGEAIRIADGIAVDGVSGRVAMHANASGTLTYRTGMNVTLEHRLTWFDRSGKTGATVGPEGLATGVDLSPDGRTVAAHVHRSNGGDLWLIDSGDGRSTRLTFDESRDNNAPVWSPDGREIAYSARHESRWAIFIKPVEGSGTERVHAESRDAPMSPMSWSAKSDALIYMRNDPTTGWDLWKTSMTDATMTPLLTRAFREGFGQLSPDARWLAYGSNESGRGEIYLESFPPGSFKRQVSDDGGDFPRWRADGAELFFFARNAGGEMRTMMASAVRTRGASVDLGKPQALFPAAVLDGPVQGHNGNFLPYVVSADGRRFLISVATGGADTSAASPAITVVVNWTADLPKRDP